MSNDEVDRLRVSPPETTAVGIPAVRHAMRYALSEMGVARSASTLLKMNQTQGFDCPGCAWPDPAPGERSHSEFCDGDISIAQSLRQLCSMPHAVRVRRPLKTTDVNEIGR